MNEGQVMPLVLGLAFFGAAGLFGYLHSTQEGPDQARMAAKGITPTGSLSAAYAWLFGIFGVAVLLLATIA